MYWKSDVELSNPIHIKIETIKDKKEKCNPTFLTVSVCSDGINITATLPMIGSIINAGNK